MGNIRHFKELRVWQMAMDGAMRIYEVSKRFPAEERYSLTDQMRRSSRSVASNISEAWRKRRYAAAWISKLSDAEGEGAETETWIEFARRCRYMSPQEADELDTVYEAILAQLTVMSENPDKWVIRSKAGQAQVPASRRPGVPASLGSAAKTA